MACITVQMISELNQPQTSLTLASSPETCFRPGAEWNKHFEVSGFKVDQFQSTAIRFSSFRDNGHLMQTKQAYLTIISQLGVSANEGW